MKRSVTFRLCWILWFICENFMLGKRGVTGNTTTLDTRHFIVAPPTLGRSIVLNDFERRREEAKKRLKRRGKRKRESSHFQLGPGGGSWRLKWCIICKSIRLLCSCMRFPLWTSLRSPESSAPWLCCSVLILWISFWTHVHLSSPYCAPASCSWCTGSLCMCPSSSWSIWWDKTASARSYRSSNKRVSFR